MANSLDFKVKKGLIVATTATIQSNTNATSTTTGALIVTGGTGIGGKLYVGGLANNTSSYIVYYNTSTGELGYGINYSSSSGSAGTATTATNIAAGTAGQLVYQTGPGATGFVGPGTAGQVLVSGGTGSPVFQNTLTLAGTTASTSTTTGALVVVGGVGIGGNLYVGGTVYATVTTATTASQVQTVRQTGNSGYYPTFVSANNGSATGMSVYTTSTFAVQPSTGNIGVGTNQFWNWGPLYHVIQKGLVYGDFYGSDSGYAGIAQNLYNDGTKWINKSDANTYPGGLYEQQSNAFTWYSSTGTAYSTATLTTLLNLENGNLSVGYPIGTSLGAKFAVNGGARINGILTATTSTIIGTTVATSTQTGALIVTGGVGVGGNLYVGGLANITYQPASNTGAGIQVSVANSQGGTGYADFLKVTNISSTVTNANKSFRVDNSGTFQIINSTYTGNIFNLTDTGDLTIIGRATFSNVTSATTTNTGALQVAGGAGIGGNVYVGGTITGDIVAATNNGSGTNFKVGDDVWIGDINVANTMGVKGQQNATVGYIKFGTGSTVGSDGTSFTVSSGMSVTGAGTFTGEVTAYSSDRRLKTNVKPIDNAVDKVLKLNGIIYTWNELAKTLVGYNTNQQVVGLFAQDLEAVLPEAVKLAPFDTDENGISKSGENYKTIQYEKVVPLLVEAIKEQQQQIIQLKNAINILSSKE